MSADARAPLPEVALADIEVVRSRLALVRPFVTAHGTESAKEVLLVRAVDIDGREGWGECAALGRPSYTGEWVDGAEAVMRRFLIPAALAGRPAGVVGHPMAAAALEAAVLHLRLAAAGVTLAAWVGAARDRVACGVAVGIAPSVDELVAEVGGFVADGYQRVKLKIRPGWDLEPVQAVRAAWPDLPLGVDANGAYARVDLDDGPLAALDRLGLVEIEQPLAAADLVGLAEAVGRLATPVCLDESIGSVADLETALALGAVDHVNLKPGRVGGVAEALRIYDLALERGVPLWVGGMLDTGVGKAVNVALAALPGACLPGDLAASRRWFTEDVTDPWEVAPDGTMGVRPLGEVRLPGKPLRALDRELQPEHPVPEGVGARVHTHDLVQRLHVAADAVSAAGHSRVGREDQAGVTPGLGGPAAGDDDEVPGVVGEEGSARFDAPGQEGLVVLSLPPLLHGCHHVVTPQPKQLGDPG